MENPLPTIQNRPDLMTRIKGLLMTPSVEWEKIATESSDVKSLFTGYVMILAAIAPIATFIGGQVFGISVLFATVHSNPISALVTAVVRYGLDLAMIYVGGLVIDSFSSTFGAVRDKAQAFKVAAYSGTAGWVAGALGIIPALGPIVFIVSLYGIYLLYRGLQKVMKTPQDKSVAYTAVVCVIMIVAALIIGAVGGIVTGVATLAGGGMGRISAISPSGNATINIPGVSANIDLNKMQAAASSMSAAAEAAKSGQPVKTADPQRWQDLLPATIDGVAKTNTESTSGGAAGVSAVLATAHYKIGDGEITIDVTDAGSMGGVLAMGAAMNLNTSKNSEHGYEVIKTENGTMVEEKYNIQDQSGEYTVTMGSRIIAVRGSHVTMDKIKAAANMIDQGRLKGL